MISANLLEILCCPETHQKVSLASPEVIEELNRQIAAGTLRNRAGAIISEKLEGGLMRQDRKIVYPMRDEIPVMLIEEGIPLA